MALNEFVEQSKTATKLTLTPQVKDAGVKVISDHTIPDVHKKLIPEDELSLRRVFNALQQEKGKSIPQEEVKDAA